MQLKILKPIPPTIWWKRMKGASLICWPTYCQLSTVTCIFLFWAGKTSFGLTRHFPVTKDVCLTVCFLSTKCSYAGSPPPSSTNLINTSLFLNKFVNHSHFDCVDNFIIQIFICFSKRLLGLAYKIKARYCINILVITVLLETKKHWCFIFTFYWIRITHFTNFKCNLKW
jgi:hypothetical protein